MACARPAGHGLARAVVEPRLDATDQEMAAMKIVTAWDPLGKANGSRYVRSGVLDGAAGEKAPVTLGRSGAKFA
jgi:hypothetical protein